MKELQQYTYTIPANGSVQIPASNDNFIVQASTGPLAVRGNTFGRLRGLVAGQGLKSVAFDRLELFDESGAPNIVTLLMTPAEFVNQTFSGSVVIVGAQALDAATIEALSRPEASTYWVDVSTMAAVSALPVFLAAANPNGAIVWGAEMASMCAQINLQAFISKATVPANLTDGRVVMQTTNGSGQFYGGKMDRPVRLPAGVGLYFMNTLLEASSGMRSCRYTLL